MSESQRETIDRVLEEYGDLEPYELREQTHSEKPWIDARKGLSDGELCDRKIEKSLMQEYYEGLLDAAGI